MLSQTFGGFELIIVDDGSNDGSEIICEEISSNDSRITVIHQKNAGLSAARNTGIQHAKGKYITFIDSDDFVSQQYVQLLYDTIVSTDSDICFCDYIKVSQSSNFEIGGNDVSLFGNKYV
ncbi:glycosyltransferase, partial [Enterococcus cecorum]|uniref:glycosyltransferase family 2 protein n=1 Tax=Enterococcus cecorum TaxID=44008 RepID=UPI001FACD11A|nr:glycosyltransferase [Enterococcus cecorum]